MSSANNLKLSADRVGPEVTYATDSDELFPVISKIGVRGWAVSDSGNTENELGYYIHIPLTHESAGYVGISFSERQLLSMLVEIKERFADDGRIISTDT